MYVHTKKKFVERTARGGGWSSRGAGAFCGFTSKEKEHEIINIRIAVFYDKLTLPTPQLVSGGSWGTSKLLESCRTRTPHQGTRAPSSCT